MRLRKLLFLAAAGLGLATCVRLAWPPPTVFRGHTHRVVAAVPSPDGKTLASTDEDNTIKLWDAASRKERATLRGGHVTFSPDGTALAWTEGPMVKLGDVTTGKERLALRGHTDNVSAVAFSPDGTILASGGSDGAVKLWDVITGTERATYRAHTPFSEAVAFSPDSKTLAWASYGRPIQLWDLATGEQRAASPVDQREFPCLAFSPDGKSLASGGNPVRLWDVSTGRETASLETPGDGVEQVLFSPDGMALAAVSSACPEVYVWDVQSGKKPASYTTGSSRPRPRLFRYVWDMFPHVFESYSCVPLSIWFTPSGQLMALGFDNRDNTTVQMWQVTSVLNSKK